MSDPSREELLEALFDFCWNSMETLEGDDPRYGLVPYDDLARIEELCIAIGGTLTKRGTRE